MAETPKCVDVLVEAMRKTKFMDESSAIDFFNDLKKRAAKKQEEENMSAKQALQNSSDEMIKEQKREARQRERGAYLDIRALVLLRDFIGKDVFDSRSQGLNAALTGDLRYKPSQRNSLHYAMLNMQNELIGFAYRALSQDNLFEDLLQNKIFEKDVAIEIFNLVKRAKEGEKTPLTGNDRAFLAAKHIKRAMENGRLLANKAGADIKEDENFIANTTHDPSQMLSATGSRLRNSALYLKLWKESSFKEANAKMKELAYIRWRDFYLPLLDHHLTFALTLTKDIDTFMRKSYQAMTTGIHLKDTIEDTGTLTDFKRIQPASRIKQQNASKVFHVKGGEEWLAYNAKYGTGSLAIAIFRTLERQGKNIALMRRFGPSSTPNFNTMLDDITADEKERDISGTQGRLRRAQHMWNFATGLTKVPVNQTLADWGLAYRQFVTMVKLPVVVFTAFEDLANRAAEMRQHGVGFLDSWRRILRRNLKGVPKKERLEIASMMRVFNTGLWGTFASRMAAFDSPAGMMSKLLSSFWKWNTMNSWDRVNSQGHALAIASYLGSLRDIAFEDLPPLERRLLLQYDIKQHEWDYYRKNATLVAGTDKTVFIAPDMVRQIGNTGLDKYLDGIGETKTDAARENALEELSEKLGMYFIDRVSHAILIPDLRESTFIIGSTRPGTLPGELMRQLSLFRGFSVSFTRKFWGRPFFGGNIDGNRDYLAMIEIMLTSTAMGAAIIDLKMMGEGREPRPLTGSFFAAAMAQGGGMSIGADFLFNSWNRFGQGLTSTLAGPGFGTLDDVATLFSKISKGDHPAEAAFQFFGRNTPFLNVLFAKTALNYLFLYSLGEAISPGYLTRMQRRLKKQQKEKFMFNPSQYALRLFG